MVSENLRSEPIADAFGIRIEIAVFVTWNWRLVAILQSLLHREDQSREIRLLVGRGILPLIALAVEIPSRVDRDAAKLAGAAVFAM